MTDVAPETRLMAIQMAWVEADENDVEPILRAAQEDIRFLRSLLLRAEEERERLREGIAEAMTSLATGPAKDGYAYSVLDSLATPEETKEAGKR